MFPRSPERMIGYKGIFSKNGHKPDAAPLTRLQQTERGLAKIARVTQDLPGRLGAFNENNPAQTEAFLKDVVRTGEVIRRLSVNAKPILEKRAAIERQRTEESARINTLLSKIRKLIQGGFLPAGVVEKAVVAVRTASLYEETTQLEKIVSSDGVITPKEAAVMALAIADAYINRESEREFALDMKFFSFFGKLCTVIAASKAPDITLDAYSYKMARNIVSGKFSFRLQNTSESTETDQTKLLVNWIKTQIKDRASFFGIVLSVEEFGDEDSMVNLKEKYWEVLKKSHDKFYSLHPEIIEREKEDVRQAIQTRFVKPYQQPILVDAKPIEVEPGMKDVEGRVEDVKIKGQIEMFSGAETYQDTPIVDERLVWVLVNYKKKEKVIMEEIEQARLHAAQSGILLFDGHIDNILAYWNLTIFRSTEQNLSSEEISGLKPEVAKLLKWKVKDLHALMTNNSSKTNWGPRVAENY